MRFLKNHGLLYRPHFSICRMQDCYICSPKATSVCGPKSVTATHCSFPRSSLSLICCGILRASQPDPVMWGETSSCLAFHHFLARIYPKNKGLNQTKNKKHGTKIEYPKHHYELHKLCLLRFTTGYRNAVNKLL